MQGEPARMIVYPPLPNGHNIKLLFTDRQLNEGIYPAMIRALKEGGFEGDGDWWKLLTTVAIGDTFSLNGPKYPNPKSYKPETMKDVFMLAERNLAHALMTAVFCKEVPYGCSPISFKEVYGSFKFDTHTAFRQATFVLQAGNGSGKDLYRITIEGTGDDLSMHWFTFEPSLTWLCSRFPDTSGGKPMHTACTLCTLCTLFKTCQSTENKTLEFRSRKGGDGIRPFKLTGIRKESLKLGRKGRAFNV